jgi:hypothetical protein
MHADRHGCPAADGLKIANECYQGKLIVLWVASGRSGLYIGRASHGRERYTVNSERSESARYPSFSVIDDALDTPSHPPIVLAYGFL